MHKSKCLNLNLNDRTSFNLKPVLISPARLNIFFISEDVAVTGIAEQRTTFDSLGAASNAIDGVMNGNYSSGTCSKSQ